MTLPADDREWGSKYLLDALDDIKRSSSPVSKDPSVTKIQKAPPSRSYPTPPQSASPTQSTFHHTNPYSPSFGQTAFSNHLYARPDQYRAKGKRRSRATSLGEKFPGDMSHRPLDQIRKDTKAANRAPHLRKKHIPGVDVIDSLDQTVGGFYHHGGPYDATLLSRNLDHKSSPVEAVRATNAEALKATPRENIRDALDKHVPLHGTAIIPPGMHGLDGRVMEYDEGADLMREPEAGGGPYKRWADVKYLPGDLKGKGEPSYSIEKSLKDSEGRRTGGTLMPDGSTAYEMQIPKQRPEVGRQRSRSQVGEGSGHDHADIRRSNTTGNRFGGGLKQRFGSLRKKKGKAVEA